MLKGHKVARIYNITHFVKKAHMFIMVRLLHIPFPMRSMFNKMLGDISSFMVEEHTFKSQDISYLGKMRPVV